MLELSDEAALLIKGLIADADLPETAGLRVGTDPDRHCLCMSLEAAPCEHDLVVEHGGVAVFLSPEAAPRLDDQVLRAQLEDRPAFFVDGAAQH